MMDRIYFENFLKNNFGGQKIVFEGEGWSSFAFTTGKNIVRFSKSNDVSGYEKEKYICDFLRDKVSFQIPKIEIVHGDVNYSIHKKLMGEKWSAETYNRLSDGDKNLFCEDIAKFFYEVHSVDLAGLDKTIIKKPERFTIGDFVNFSKELFSAKEIDRLYKYYCDIFDSGSDFVLAHQDFCETNSLVDENHRLKAVFDFGNCGIDERCLEFRPLYYRATNNYDGGTFKKIIEKYEIISGAKVDAFRLNLLIDIETFGCLKYLSSTGLKEKMTKEWEESVERARNILKYV